MLSRVVCPGRIISALTRSEMRASRARHPPTLRPDPFSSLQRLAEQALAKPVRPVRIDVTFTFPFPMPERCIAIHDRQIHQPFGLETAFIDGRDPEQFLKRFHTCRVLSRCNVATKRHGEPQARRFVGVTARSVASVAKGTAPSTDAEASSRRLNRSRASVSTSICAAVRSSRCALSRMPSRKMPTR